MPQGDSREDWVRSAVGQFERPLLGYALRLCGGDAERARDVVQETFARLVRQSPAARAELNGRLAEWLYTVCRNAALDVRRKEKRVMAITDEAAAVIPSSSLGPDVVAETRDSTSHVLKLLGRLPENQQEVIRLKFQHGMSYRQIAAITGHSETNVGFLIHRGVRAMREQMRA